MTRGYWGCVSAVSVGTVNQLLMWRSPEKVTREGHPEAAMTPGRIFCLRGEWMNAKPSLPSVSLLSSSFGAQRGERRHREAVLLIHALTDSWLQLAEDGTEEEGDCGQDRVESRREVLNHSRSGEKRRDIRGFARHWVSRHGSFYAERVDVIELRGVREEGWSLTMYGNAEICCIRSHLQFKDKLRTMCSLLLKRIIFFKACHSLENRRYFP